MTHQTNRTRIQLARRLADAAEGIGDAALVLAIQKRCEVIEVLNRYGRGRRFAMKQQQKLDRSMESYIRINYTDWTPQEDEDARDKYKKEVQRLKTAAVEGQPNPHPERSPEEWDWDGLITLMRANLEARRPFDQIRESTETKMIELASTLHVAPWIESVHGIGIKGLAIILAETGSFDTYANPEKLFARLGYAPYKGHAGSTWKRPKWHQSTPLTKEEWIAHPFSPSRYAAMYVQSTHLVDHQWIGAKKTGTSEGRPDGRYGEVYAARRIRTQITHPDWSDGHRRKDGLRKAFKQFLIDLWEKWIDLSFDVGHSRNDAQRWDADIAAADQETIDAQDDHADGGPSSRAKRKPNGRGQPTRDAHQQAAATAAVGHRLTDPQVGRAGGGTNNKSKSRVGAAADSRSRRRSSHPNPHRSTAVP